MIDGYYRYLTIMNHSCIIFYYRFVFYECASMKLDDKVTFPLVGLSVGRHLYDLYACVCHFGGT